MMRTETERNSVNLLLIALVLAAASVACTRVTELVRGPTQPEKVRRLNSEVPSGIKNAERVYLKESSFVIVLSDSNEILLKNADGEPIAVEALNKMLTEYLANTPKYDAKIYIKAGAGRDPRTFVALLDEIRKHDIDEVNLLVSRRTAEENASDFRAGRDVPEPDHAFEVRVRSQISYFRPNPLLLVARGNAASGRITINNEDFGTHDSMIDKLKEILRQRESYGVFREGKNEVEATVKLVLEEQIGKYGDVIKLVDALKLAGANPIVLIKEGDEFDIPEDLIPTPDTRQGRAVDTTDKKPKMISGGVLNGQANSLPKPSYPPAARAVRATGAVTVEVTVDTNGNVVSASAVSGHPLLRAAAAQAARSAKFSPTLLSGEPVSVKGVLTYNFELPQ
jgi:TonB family protein